MIYGPQRMKRLADDIRDFLKENHLEADYFGRLCSGQPAGFKLPAMETVIDNGSLRYELICYLSYRTSLIADEARNEWGAYAGGGTGRDGSAPGKGGERHGTGGAGGCRAFKRAGLF